MNMNNTTEQITNVQQRKDNSLLIMDQQVISSIPTSHLRWIEDASNSEDHTLRFIPSSQDIHTLCIQTGFSQHYLDIVFRYFFVLGSKKIFELLNNEWQEQDKKDQEAKNSQIEQKNMRDDAELLDKERALASKQELEQEQKAIKEKQRQEEANEAGVKKELLSEIQTRIEEIKTQLESAYGALPSDKRELFTFDEFWTDTLVKRSWREVMAMKQEKIAMTLKDLENLNHNVQQYASHAKDKEDEIFEDFIDAAYEYDKRWLKGEMEDMDIRLYDIACNLCSHFLKEKLDWSQPEKTWNQILNSGQQTTDQKDPKKS